LGYFQLLILSPLELEIHHELKVAHDGVAFAVDSLQFEQEELQEFVHGILVLNYEIYIPQRQLEGQALPAVDRVFDDELRAYRNKMFPQHPEATTEASKDEPFNVVDKARSRRLLLLVDFESSIFFGTGLLAMGDVLMGLLRVLRVVRVEGDARVRRRELLQLLLSRH